MYVTKALRFELPGFVRCNIDMCHKTLHSHLRVAAIGQEKILVVFKTLTEQR